MSESILIIEEKRREIENFLSSPLSDYKKLSLLSNFFSLLLAANNKNLLQAFSAGLIAPLSNYLTVCDVACVPPGKHNRIIATTEAIIASQAFPDTADTLKQSLTSFNEKVKELTAVLNGEDGFVLGKNKYLFPLLDTTNNNGDLYGMLDSITVKITKGKEEKFHLIPSEKEIEARIKTQIETSWNVAVAYARKNIKHISPHHEVIVSFDKRVGFYVGDSLGVALTLAYINELFLYYNAPLTITAKEGSCFTGSLLQSGEIPSIGEENIKKKVELIFYSQVKTFVLPKEDEPEAEKKLRELKKEYSSRNLKLIAVTDIEDLLTRRNVVDIKKLSIVIRTRKTVIGNKLVTALVFALIGILSFFYFYQYDDNPASLDHDGTTLFVKNKAGKVLWTKKQNFFKPYLNQENFTKNFFRILDVDNDGKNEILMVAVGVSSEMNSKEKGGITCLKNDGILRWKYVFHDTVKTKREIFTTNWNEPIMFDTASVNGRKILICANSNNASFATAIFKLDLLNGARLPGTFWHAGQTGNGFVKDLNNDGKQELIVVGCSNSFNQAGVLFVLPVDKLNGHGPSSEEYRFYEFPKAELLAYFKIPQTDLSAYFGDRNSNIEPSSLLDRNDISKIVFNSIESVDSSAGSLYYFLDYNLKDFNVVVSSGFAYPRDKLVKKKILSLPYSDTKEYHELIKSQIQFWNGKEFVTTKY